jgi:hypothetical protein
MSDGDDSDDSDSEVTPVECEFCGLSFEVIASNDYWIAAGKGFTNYCPRCGELVAEESSWP